MYKRYNPNPDRARVGDCVIRAVAKATNQTWDETYINLAIQGFTMRDMPSSNEVWGEYLRSRGFTRRDLGDCCTVRSFAEAHPSGVYVLGTGTHVVTVENGDYYDAWDSGDEAPIYVWRRKDEL